MLKSYKEMLVWQRSIELVREVYRLTKLFPSSELYGITNQMRRAAVSIPSNIAEGFTRGHHQEYIQFIRIAFASGAELETQLIISQDLGLAPSSEFQRAGSILEEVMKMLNRLQQVLVSSR